MRLNAQRSIAVLMLLAALGAGAIELDEAKSEGLVGETWTGYIAPVETPASAEVRALIAEINDKRRGEYEKVAAQNGISVADVEQIAAKKLVENAAPGTFVKLAGDDWRRK